MSKATKRAYSSLPYLAKPNPKLETLETKYLAESLKEIKKYIKTADLRRGICLYLKPLNKDFSFGQKSLLKTLFTLWPEFSGYTGYPIEIETAAVIGKIAQFNQVAWPKYHPYGMTDQEISAYTQARARLLDFMVLALRTELAARQNFAERQLIAAHNWQGESLQVRMAYLDFQVLKQNLLDLGIEV